MCERECVYVRECESETETETETETVTERGKLCVRDYNCGDCITVVMVGFHDLRGGGETGGAPASFDDSKLNKIAHYKVFFYLVQ